MSTENNVFNQDIWSSGSQKSKADATRKIIMTSTTNYGAMLFPKKTHEQKPEFTAEASPDAGSIEKSEDGKKAENAYPGDIKTEDEKKDKYARANAALIKNGYDPKNYKDETLNHIEKALSERGGVISEFTGRAWLAKENEVQEPPAFVRPKTLSVGNKVQLLNWHNMGVHGAQVDLFPAAGKVTKIYSQKVRISKDKMPYTVVPVKGAAFDDEDRIIGLELDGHGPSKETIKDVEGAKDNEKYPVPYLTKESSVILKFDDGGTTLFRQPPLGTPAGSTQHVEPNMQ
jgi:hypothetical protein